MWNALWAVLVAIPLLPAAQPAAGPPPIAGEALMPERPAPSGPRIVFETPSAPAMLQAGGDCKQWFNRSDWARTALCASSAGDKSRPLLALAQEQLGRHDEAARTWSAWARSAYGQNNLEATRRANALARVEDAIALLVRGKARPAAKQLAMAAQTFKRQARLRRGLQWRTPGPAMYSHALALRAARKKRPAGKALSMATACKGSHAAHAAPLQKVRMKQRRERRGPWPWVERIHGGAGDDAINAAVALSGGDLLLAGGKQVAGAEGIQLHIWRVDGSGRMRWEQSFGAAGRDEAHALAILPDNGWLAVGETAGQNGKPDAWMVRFGADRNVRWHRSVGGDGEDRAVALLARPDGGARVAVAADQSSDQADMGLLNLSASGQPGGMERLGGAGRQVPAALVAHNKGMVLAGRSRVGKTPWQALLIALDSSGSPRWQHLAKAGDESSFDALVVGRKGAIVAIGRHRKARAAHAMLQLSGFDKKGRRRWQKTDRTFSAVQPVAAASLGRKGLAVLTTGRLKKRRADVWVVGYKRKGRPAWRAAVGAGPADSAAALLAVGRGGLVVAGATNEGSAGGSDGWMVRLGR